MQNAKSIAVGSFFMVLRQRMAALLLGLAVVGPAAAGEESESHISRPGLFFAWLSPDLGPSWSVPTYRGWWSASAAMAGASRSGAWPVGCGKWAGSGALKPSPPRASSARSRAWRFMRALSPNRPGKAPCAPPPAR